MEPVREPQSPGEDPRVYLAAERTLLAWIRTGLALMGFGFVVARFGLFLRELAAVEHQAPKPGTAHSLWVGVGLIVIGIAVNLLSTVKYHREIGRLRRGESIRPGLLSLATVVAVALAALGVVMALYLVVGLQEPH